MQGLCRALFHARCARVPREVRRSCRQFESAYLTLAPERVGTERGAETSIACRRSTVHAAKAVPPEGPAWQASTRRHATNVKYALSKVPRHLRQSTRRAAMGDT